MERLNVAILLDSKDQPWKLGPGWLEYSDPQFMGGSTAWARYNDSTDALLEFTGTGISYLGNAVPDTIWSFMSSIDGSALEHHSMKQEYGFEQLTYDWYTSPELSAGKHTLELSAISRGVALDYAVIKPSPTQSVRGQTLIVDDRDPLMKFTGSWKDVSSRYSVHEHRAIVPYGGGTHVSSQVGDVLRFPFTGSTIRVYGFYDQTTSGGFTLSFGLDGAREEIVYQQNVSASYAIQPHYLFYEKAMPSGDHILTLNITNIAGAQRVIIDAIHYIAAFDTLDNMPQIRVPDGPSSTSEATALSAKNGEGNHPATRVIVGAVIGGVSCILLVVLGILVWRSTKRSRQPPSQQILSENHSELSTSPLAFPNAASLLFPKLSRN